MTINILLPGSKHCALRLELKNRLLQIFLCILLSISGQAQILQLLNSGTSVSLRGLSVVNDQVLWVSGSEGTVGLSTNGGISWKWTRVPHYEKSDFRDIEAFSDREAIIMGITEPAVILLTTDGGNSWTTKFEDSSKTAFLDAMDFSGDHMVVVGDPVGDHIFFAESTDWREEMEYQFIIGYDTDCSRRIFFCSQWNQYSISSGWILGIGIRREKILHIFWQFTHTTRVRAGKGNDRCQFHCHKPCQYQSGIYCWRRF